MPKSFSESPCRSSRERGPQTLIIANDDITSRNATDPSFGRCFLSHMKSCTPKAVPVMMKNLSFSTRETVTSASIPPRLLQNCVYTVVPTGLFRLPAAT